MRSGQVVVALPKTCPCMPFDSESLRVWCSFLQPQRWDLSETQGTLRTVWNSQEGGGIRGRQSGCQGTRST